MAAAAILDFQNFEFFNNYHMYVVFLHFPVQFGDNRPINAKMASIYSMFLFALKMPNHAPFWALFGVKHPQISKIKNSDPQKAPPCAIPRRLSVFAWKSVNRYGRGAIPRKKKKKRKKERKKSQYLYITPPRGAATAYAIGIILCSFDWPYDVITHTYFENNRLKNVGWAEGWNLVF